MVRRGKREDFFIAYVCLIPTVADDEPKSKPAQHAVQQLNEAGLDVDLLICRSTEPLPRPFLEKVHKTCMDGHGAVLGMHNLSNIYRVPLFLRECGLDLLLAAHFGIAHSVVSASLAAKAHTSSDSVLIAPATTATASAVAPPLAMAPMLVTTSGDASPVVAAVAMGKAKSVIAVDNNTWSQWEAIAAHLDASDPPQVRIALVGKYVELHDSYLSITHALNHAAFRNKCTMRIVWVDSERLTDDHALDSAFGIAASVKDGKEDAKSTCVHGILVPGGFGFRGTEGMIRATRWARERGVPWLGICLGMQVGVIEYARSCCGVPDATSEEFVDEKSGSLGSNSLQSSMDSASSTTTPVKIDDRKYNNNVDANVVIVAEKLAMSASASIKTMAPTSSPSSTADDAASVPALPDTRNVIVFMPEGSTTHYNGTMRLGERLTKIQPGTLAAKVYDNRPFVSERHRHRYEVNPDYVPLLTSSAQIGTTIADDKKNVRPSSGHEPSSATPQKQQQQQQQQRLLFSGVDAEQGNRHEIFELQGHPFFMGLQCHPEFKSRPFSPSPPFVAFVRAALTYATA